MLSTVYGTAEALVSARAYIQQCAYSVSLTPAELDAQAAALAAARAYHQDRQRRLTPAEW